MTKELECDECGNRSFRLQKILGEITAYCTKCGDKTKLDDVNCEVNDK